MTLQLRRKRPTTPPSSPAAKGAEALARALAKKPTHAARRACRKLLATISLNSLALWMVLAAPAAMANPYLIKQLLDEEEAEMAEWDEAAADAIATAVRREARRQLKPVRQSFHRSITTHKIGSFSPKGKDIKSSRAQSTHLRWRSQGDSVDKADAKPETASDATPSELPSATPSESPAAASEQVEQLAAPVVEEKVAAEKQAIEKEQADKEPATTHAEEESVHIELTAGAMSTSDPFADPFFEANARPKLRVHPIVAQPTEPAMNNVDPFANDPPAEEPAKTEVPAESTEDPTAEPSADETPAPHPEMESPPTTPEYEPRSETGQPPSVEEAQGPSGELPRCKTPEELLKRIRDITTDISAEAGDFPPECPLGNASFQPRQFASTVYTWKASGLCHKPLYFQEMALERYGHSWGPMLQPVVSGAHFFVSAALLPYQMGIEPPWECIYALGYYRPGSCAPKMIYPIPISLRGGLLEGAFIGSLVAILP